MEIKRLRSEGLSYNDISKYLNKVEWKIIRGNKFYNTNILSFEKRVEKSLQLTQYKDGFISEIKIVFDDNSNKMDK